MTMSRCARSRPLPKSGVTLFDVAPLYGRGLAEHRFGTRAEAAAARFLRALHQGRALAQAGARAGPTTPSRYRGGLSFDVVVDYSYDGTMRAFEQSLQRLALPSIDVALIHDVDVWTHGDQIETRFKEAMDGAYRALDDCAREGSSRRSASA